jgi:hypothetical protein
MAALAYDVRGAKANSDNGKNMNFVINVVFTSPVNSLDFNASYRLLIIWLVFSYNCFDFNGLPKLSLVDQTPSFFSAFDILHSTAPHLLKQD